MKRNELVNTLDVLLDSRSVKDYCPNGLQVEGADNIEKVVTGVTASQALIDAAIAQNADAILVHHGYFWKGENATITGIKRKRIGALLANNINLLAYHLPIDIHESYGNNVQLGQRLGFENLEPLDALSPLGIVYQGQLAQPQPLSQVVDTITQRLDRAPLVEEVGDKLVSTAAWCTGGGQGYIDAAIDAGVDLFITGEVSEQTIHTARERGIHFIAAGHHATERYGVKTVGEYLASQYNLDVTFIDIDNPA